MNKTTYHEQRSASGSLLRVAYNEGPAGVWQAMTSRSKPSPAMEFGTACHTAFLEPHLFDGQIAVRPEGLDGRTKEGKLWLQSVGDRIVLTQAAAASAHELADRAKAYLEAYYPPLADAQWIVETPIFADVLGHPCRCMPDILIDSSAFSPFAWTVVSYKTARAVDPEAWTRAVVSGMRAGYDIAEALYRRVIAADKGCEPEDVAILHLVNCTSYPGVRVFEPAPELLARADEMLPRLLEDTSTGLRHVGAPTFPMALTFAPPAIVGVPKWADSAGSAVTEEDDNV